MFLWEVIEHPGGYTVTAEEFNNRWNLIQAQNDEQARKIRQILDMLYETLLHDEDGSAHLRVGLPEYAADNLKEVLQIIDTRLKIDAQNLLTHKTSDDHDHRYYTEEELNVMLSALHNEDARHRESSDHDYRYYTRQELTPWLRGGDTTIKEEVFNIINPNNGDGTFTYETQGMQVVGELTEEGHQIFGLLDGIYALGMNRLEVIINDTLRRSVASGGIEEIDIDRVALTSPEGAGAEITIKYYERLGIAAEYNVVVGPDKPPQNEGKNMWFRILE